MEILCFYLKKWSKITEKDIAEKTLSRIFHVNIKNRKLHNSDISKIKNS